MSNKWVISDTHFGHANIIKFTKPDGTPIRPGFTRRPTRAITTFKDIQHHDECLIDNWNSVVAPFDKVYFLGDFGNINVAPRLHGKKRIILGNHDDMIDKHDLVKYFEKILVTRRFKNDFTRPVIFSHYPLHKDEAAPSSRLINVHGHIHEKIIKDVNGHPDPWYVNVSVEQTNCYPVSWDELGDIIKKRNERITND
jgi:calcineurin-like phosphoesterase family protein